LERETTIASIALAFVFAFVCGKGVGGFDEKRNDQQVRALAGRGFCKPCEKFYDDNKGLEAHEKRHHPSPPVQSDEKDADGERET